MQQIDERVTIKTAPQPNTFVEVRGPLSGHLYGRLDPATGMLEVRKGGLTEVIDIRRLLLTQRQVRRDDVPGGSNQMSGEEP